MIGRSSEAMKIYKRLSGVIGCILLALIVSMGVYLQIYYHAEEEAYALATEGKEQEGNHEDIVFEPEGGAAETGFILYPGAKVQCEAYAPLMKKISEGGVLCAIAHMPGNMAMFRKDAAADIMAKHPEIKHWYIGGHSLGGVIASSYASDNPDVFEGIIFLASYTIRDFSSSSIKVISIYGTNDMVLNKESFEKNYVNLPERTQLVILDGGNHSQFGEYGFQKGDGKATISGDEQRLQTANAILEFLEE